MIKMDDEVRNELDVLATTRKRTVQELGIEAICDLLRKYDRPVSFRDALRRSAGAAPSKPGAAPPKGASAKNARRKTARGNG
jgi:hypothetical protein